MTAQPSSGSSRSLNYAPYSIQKRDYHRRISGGGRRVAGPSTSRPVVPSDAGDQPSTSHPVASSDAGGQPSTPYRLTSGDLERLYEDLQYWNTMGVMLTFDMARKDWPVNWSTKPPTPVAARRFPDRKIENLPLCPHVCFEEYTFKDCQMESYREVHEGHHRYVFAARDHGCEFKVVIPPVDPSMPFTVFLQDQLRTTYPLRRYPIPDRQEPSTPVAVQHVDEVDIYLNETLWYRHGHPASDRGQPPSSLARYHQCTLEFHDLRLDTTMVANGMRAFNSADGVLPNTWLLLISCQTYCMGCTNIFSNDGYSAHIDTLGHCPLTPSELRCVEVTKGQPHPANSYNKPPSVLRQYHPDYISPNSPPPPDLFRTTAVGRALLKWNSSIGISMDAWRTITTAFVHCDGCNRFRSFDGDCLHRDVRGFPSCGGRALGTHEGAEQPVNFDDANEVKEEAREYILVDDD